MATKPDDDLELDWGGRTRPEDRGTSPRGATPPANASAQGGVPRPSSSLESRFGGSADPSSSHLSPALEQALQPLLHGERLRVVQERQIGEGLTNIELRNSYRIMDESQQLLLDAVESGSGVGAFLVRQFFKSGRGFEMDLTTSGGTVALQLRRPFSWWLSRMEVTSWNGRPLGAIQQRFQFLTRRLELLSPQGKVLAFLYGPAFKPWTFQLIQNGRQVGQIVKQWSGLFTEVVTNADDFSIELAPSVDARVRQLTVAAAILIDFLYFERRERR